VATILFRLQSLPTIRQITHELFDVICSDIVPLIAIPYNPSYNSYVK